MTPVLAILHFIGFLSIFAAVATVLVLAAFLIAVPAILNHVSNRLVAILGVIWSVSEKTQGLDTLIEAINVDLDAARSSLEGRVNRIVERTQEPVS